MSEFVQLVRRPLRNKLRKLALEHRLCEALGASLREMLRQLLIELALKNFFGTTAVKVGRFADRRTHGFEHLAEKGFADELREALAEFVRLEAVVERGAARW